MIKDGWSRRAYKAKEAVDVEAVVVAMNVLRRSPVTQKQWQRRSGRPKRMCRWSGQGHRLQLQRSEHVQ